MIVGSIARTACGISTLSMTWVLLIPRAYAASLCPLGTELMPARSTSAWTQPL